MTINSLPRSYWGVFESEVPCSQGSGEVSSDTGLKSNRGKKPKAILCGSPRHRLPTVPYSFSLSMSSDHCFVRSRHSWEALHFSKSCHLEQNLLSWNSWAPELSPHRLLPPAAPSGYKAPLSVHVSSRMSPAEQGHEHSPAVVWPGQGALGSCILWSVLCATMNRVPTCLVFVAAAFLSWCLMRAPLFLFPFSLSFFLFSNH